MDTEKFFGSPGVGVNVKEWRDIKVDTENVCTILETLLIKKFVRKFLSTLRRALFPKMKICFLFLSIGTSLFETLAFSVSRLDNAEKCQDQITHFLGNYVLSGEPASIHCPFSKYLEIDFIELSDHSLELVWTKNYSEDLNFGEDSRLQKKEEELWFFPAIKDDSGIYSCILRNTSFCMEVTLEFNVIEQSEVSLADIAYTQIAFEKADFLMYCPDLDYFTESHTGVQLKWFKEGELLPKDSMEYEILDHSTFIKIKDVQKEDEGYYTCQLLFTHMNREFAISRIISLQTIAGEKREHPVIVQRGRKSVAASIGSKLTVPCKVFTGFGNNNLIVWWLANDTFIEDFFNNGRVTEGSFQKTTEADGHYIEVPLIFQEIKDEDFSTNFKCVARNDYGIQVLPTQIKPAASPFSWYIVAVPAVLICLIVAVISMYKYRKSRDKKHYFLTTS
ncbi:interleukin-1 receptor type 2 [Pelodytes ibericus]